MLSYQSLMPAGAGTPRYEKRRLWLGTVNWHCGFCHAPPPPQRGTSPSPREVFDRATFFPLAPYIGRMSRIPIVVGDCPTPGGFETRLYGDFGNWLETGRGIQYTS